MLYSCEWQLWSADGSPTCLWSTVNTRFLLLLLSPARSFLLFFKLHPNSVTSTSPPSCLTTTKSWSLHRLSFIFAPPSIFTEHAVHSRGLVPYGTNLLPGTAVICGVLLDEGRRYLRIRLCTCSRVIFWPFLLTSKLETCTITQRNLISNTRTFDLLQKRVRLMMEETRDNRLFCFRLNAIMQRI